jgi:hypothetical protein
MSPFSTNPTIGTAIKSTDWQDATKQSKNMQLPNGSSSQHAQSHSDTYGSPQNAARRLKVVDLLNISSSQHARSAPYVTATGPSTQPVGHTPTSACTSNTDAMYSPTETEEQVPDAIYSPYSPTAMEEQVPDAIYSPYSPTAMEEQVPDAIYSPYSPTAMEEQVPDAIYSPYSPNTTEEQAPPSSTASYYTAEETSGLGQSHLELQGQASPQCEGTGASKHPTSFLQTLRR